MALMSCHSALILEVKSDVEINCILDALGEENRPADRNHGHRCARWRNAGRFGAGDDVGPTSLKTCRGGKGFEGIYGEMNSPPHGELGVEIIAVDPSLPLQRQALLTKMAGGYDYPRLPLDYSAYRRAAQTLGSCRIYHKSI